MNLINILLRQSLDLIVIKIICPSKKKKKIYLKKAEKIYVQFTDSIRCHQRNKCRDALSKNTVKFRYPKRYKCR